MDIALYRYTLPFSQPLSFHEQTLIQREGLLLRWDDNWGEIAPLPGFSRETLLEAEQECLRYLNAYVKGLPFHPTLPSVQFGVECARRTWPKLKYLPLPPYLLLQGTPDEMYWNFKDWTYDYPSKVKIKVARYPMDQELALIRELHKMAPQTKFVLDANQGWEKSEAWAFMSLLDGNYIDYIEDPCKTFKDIKSVAAHTAVNVALDEILSRQQEWDFFPQLKAIVLKPMLIGSLEHCKALLERARAHNVKVIISSCHESQLGNRLLAQLAAEWSPEQPPGLDTVRFLADTVLDEKQQPDLKKLKQIWHS